MSRPARYNYRPTARVDPRRHAYLHRHSLHCSRFHFITRYSLYLCSNNHRLLAVDVRNDFANHCRHIFESKETLRSFACQRNTTSIATMQSHVDRPTWPIERKHDTAYLPHPLYFTTDLPDRGRLPRSTSLLLRRTSLREVIGRHGR